MKEYVKDPEATLDYGSDWSAWLEDDELVSSEWKVPRGLIVMDEVMTPIRTIIWISGGRHGKDYVIRNYVITKAGRKDARSKKIKVRHK